MSTGDWFTLNPLNLKNYQTEIDDLSNRLTSLQLLTNDLNTRLTIVESRLSNVEQFADTINVNLLNLTQQVNSMNQSINQSINSLQSSIDNILNQYTPIEGFQFNVINFTDGGGNNLIGSLHGAWYRPITLRPSNISNDGVGLKYLLLVVRGITANIPENDNFFFSDPISLPVSFVNNNNFRVYWNSGEGFIRVPNKHFIVLLIFLLIVGH
jgi:hypothetical protein